MPPPPLPPAAPPALKLNHSLFPPVPPPPKELSLPRFFDYSAPVIGDESPMPPEFTPCVFVLSVLYIAVEDADTPNPLFCELEDYIMEPIPAPVPPYPPVMLKPYALEDAAPTCIFYCIDDQPAPIEFDIIDVFGLVITNAADD